MINLHDLGVNFVLKAHNERIKHAQMLCNFTPNNCLIFSISLGFTKINFSSTSRDTQAFEFVFFGPDHSYPPSPQCILLVTQMWLLLALL